MRRTWLRIFMLLIWVGGLGILVSFLVKTLFQFTVSLTPAFFLSLLIGLLGFLLFRIF